MENYTSLTNFTFVKINRMLINLTNHPATGWSSQQSETAIRQFGAIFDQLPFPIIPPEATTDEVEMLSKTYLEKVKHLLPCPMATDAVHLMGEQVFCFRLGRMLVDAGYRVVASTTNRQTFKFVQFREY